MTTELILTCEHADRRIPRRYGPLFAGAAETLASHRGWDPGALRIATRLARHLGVPLHATRWSRLLVEANRSPSNPRLWSRFTRDLPADERARILERYWLPHRRAVETAVSDALAGRGRVVHVAVHSFTPVLDGAVRNAEVGLLYDSARPLEAAFARRWRAALRELAPGLRVRLNYPYLGRADGLPRALRNQHAPGRYLGFELEVNQALATGPGWRTVADQLASSLARALGDAAGSGSRRS